MEKTLGFDLWNKLDQFVGKKVEIKKEENVSEKHYDYADGEWRFSWSKIVQMLITYEGVVERAEINSLVLTDCKITNPPEINDPNPWHERLKLFVPNDGRMIFSVSLCESVTIVG